MKEIQVVGIGSAKALRQQWAWDVWDTADRNKGRKFREVGEKIRKVGNRWGPRRLNVASPAPPRACLFLTSGTWRVPSHLNPLLAQCGYFLHPTPAGDFIFRARYSACFMRKEVRLGHLTGLDPRASRSPTSGALAFGGLSGGSREASSVPGHTVSCQGACTQQALSWPSGRARRCGGVAAPPTCTGPSSPRRTPGFGHLCRSNMVPHSEPCCSTLQRPRTPVLSLLCFHCGSPLCLLLGRALFSPKG